MCLPCAHLIDQMIRASLVLRKKKELTKILFPYSSKVVLPSHPMKIQRRRLNTATNHEQHKMNIRIQKKLSFHMVTDYFRNDSDNNHAYYLDNTNHLFKFKNPIVFHIIIKENVVFAK